MDDAGRPVLEAGVVELQTGLSSTDLTGAPLVVQSLDDWEITHRARIDKALGDRA